MGKTLKDTLDISRPQPRLVHGIEVRKMPMGAYIAFAQKGGQLLPALLDKLFPGMSGVEVATTVMAQSGELLYRTLGTLLVEAPEAIMEALAALLAVPVEKLMDNPDIGPGELLDILEAWKEANDLSDFFSRVSALFRRP